MTGYWNSPELSFFSDGSETKGWSKTLENYRASYAGPNKEMGSLDFQNLRVEALGPEAAFVRGEFRLAMSRNKVSRGRFTLVVRRFPDGWKIVHDHSSS